LIEDEVNYADKSDRNIYINNDGVHRPTRRSNKQVYAFLGFLKEQGFNQAPEFLGYDLQGREILSFVKGKTGDFPLSAESRSLDALVSSAKLLRVYHDASYAFLQESACSNEGWMFPAQEPREVICHNDFAPYNVCFDGKKAIGIIDFDTAHPAPRIWDIAYALYRFAPFTNPENEDGFGKIEEQILRGRLFCESYGLHEKNRSCLAEVMIERLQVLLDFLMQSACEGDEKYQLNVQHGHHLKYLADMEYIKLHTLKIKIGLV